MSSPMAFDFLLPFLTDENATRKSVLRTYEILDDIDRRLKVSALVVGEVQRIMGPCPIPLWPELGQMPYPLALRVQETLRLLLPAGINGGFHE